MKNYKCHITLLHNTLSKYQPSNDADQASLSLITTFKPRLSVEKSECLQTSLYQFTAKGKRIYQNPNQLHNGYAMTQKT